MLWNPNQVYNNFIFALRHKTGMSLSRDFVYQSHIRRGLLHVLTEAATAPQLKVGARQVYAWLEQQKQQSPLPFSLEQLWAVLSPILRASYNTSQIELSQQATEEHASYGSYSPQPRQSAGPTGQYPMMGGSSAPPPGAPAPEASRERRRGSQNKYYTGNYPRIEKIAPGASPPQAAQPSGSPTHNSNRYIPSGHPPQQAPSSGRERRSPVHSSDFPNLGSTSSANLPGMAQPTGQYPRIGGAAPAHGNYAPPPRSRNEAPRRHSSQPQQQSRGPSQPPARQAPPPAARRTQPNPQQRQQIQKPPRPAPHREPHNPSSRVPQRNEPTAQYPSIGSSSNVPKPRQPTRQLPHMGSSQAGLRKENRDVKPKRADSRRNKPKSDPSQDPSSRHFSTQKTLLLTPYSMTNPRPLWDQQSIYSQLSLKILQAQNAPTLLDYLEKKENSQQLLQALGEAAQLERADKAIEEFRDWFIYSTYKDRLAVPTQQLWAMLEEILNKALHKVSSKGTEARPRISTATLSSDELDQIEVIFDDPSRPSSPPPSHYHKIPENTEFLMQPEASLFDDIDMIEIED